MRKCKRCRRIKEDFEFRKPSSKLCTKCSEWWTIYQRNYRKHWTKKQRQYHNNLNSQYAKTTQRFNRAKNQAKQKGCSWEIPREEFYNLINNPCHYCGKPLNLYGCGLDRKNNEKIYSLSTVVPCCKICNTIKSNHFTYEQMLKIGAFLKTL